jgi:dsDNA-binding SOS-regulon protein
MTSSKPILYDLGVAVGAVTLWLTPLDLTRALGYTVSLLFSSRAYYTGICLLSEERKADEKAAIAYEAETDFYDQLLGTNIEAVLEVKALEVENKMIERILPLMRQKSQLERQLQAIRPIRPELSEEEREQAAKSAIDDAFVGGEPKSDRPAQISEEDIRKQFPEEMDTTSWKAILKALQNEASSDEIIRDVFGCSSQPLLGKAYLDLLKRKFMG